MKFDVDYDEILKNRLLLKTKKIEGGGAVSKTKFFSQTPIEKIFS
jgi:hypothetical protein